MHLPTNDFVTTHGVESKTFKAPPLDGSHTLAQMVDFHGENSNNHTWAVYIDENGKLCKVSWKMLQNAMHRVAKIINNRLPTNEKATIAVLASRDQLTYIAILAGILRTGNTAFLVSPRNSLPGVVHLLEATKTNLIIGSDDYREQNLMNGAVGKLGHKVTTLNAPLFTDIFNFDISNDPIQYLPPLMAPNDSEEVSIIIHSSGSTAFPKPIPLSHLGVLQWARIPSYGYHDMCGERVGIQSAPPFHGMGFFHALAVPCGSGCEIAVFKPQEPPLMPTPERVLESFIATKITISTGPPTNLVQWIKDPSAVQFLSSLKWVRTGGGPCPKAVGDYLVSKGVRLLNGWGTTEVGVLSNPSPKEPYGHDWEYIECTRNCKPFFKPVDEEGDFYEICFPCTTTHIPSVFTDIENRIYETNDMVELHPTKPGLFKVVGRVDDQIMLSTGEKTNPGPLEHVIKGDKMIKQAIYFGRGQFNNGILIEPEAGFEVDVTDDNQVSSFRNMIWPVIQQANNIAPTHSRVYKEMILITTPNKPIMLTPKQSVARNKTLTAYQDEIREIYRRSEEAEGEDVAFPSKDKINEESLFNYVATVVEKIMRPDEGEINKQQDLFEQGCDSLQATVIKNRISAGLRKSGFATRSIPQNWVYMQPTIKGLCDSMMEIIQGKSVENRKLTPELLEEIALGYCKGFITHTGNTPLPEKRHVIITGTTGTLGSYLLHEYYHDPTVAKIYAINRPSRTPIKDRQKEAWLDRGLDILPLENKARIKLVEADLSQENFGIQETLYKEMQNSVTHIIHNAWRLDFNLGIKSFEPNIKGVKNLANFALGTSFCKPPIILNTSSVGVVSSYTEGWVKESRARPIDVAPTGYGQSKFVAERILETAHLEKNLPVKNIRIGQLSGSKVNGSWNTSDWFPMIAKSGELGVLPAGSAPIAWVPVDTAAKVINDYSMSSSNHVTLHLVHPNPVSWDIMISYVSKVMAAKLVNVSEWLSVLQQTDDMEKTPALKLLPFYQLKASTMERPGTFEAFGLPRLETIKSKEESKTLSNMEPLEENDFDNWLRYWTKHNFLNKVKN